MKYYSTRNKSLRVSGAQAIAQGLSEDGGLFLPESIPAIPLEEIKRLCEMNYRERAVDIMSRFLDDFSREELEGFTDSAYARNFDNFEIAPLSMINDKTAFLELWHGPTCAFKDMALQMLPHLLTASLKKIGESKCVCILVATSGDTGKAALDGFADIPGTGIVVFYPCDGVSDVQKLQMTTQEGENVHVCAVNGNFDDTQTGVKVIFNDRIFAEKLAKKGFLLSSANSINWGRLLPQIVYYFSAYCDYTATGKLAFGEELDFCVPTGNFGDILAGWYAKKMGLPIRRLICASNSNRVLTDFLATGVYDKNRQFYTTTSPSMDILISSNLERLLFMLSDDESVCGWMNELSTTGKYDVGKDIHAALTAEFTGGCCDDSEAKKAIADVFSEKAYLMDTHTAVAYKVLENLREREGSFPTVVVSTASPYKFCDSVLEALGKPADKPGPELLRELAQTSGTAIPKPLQRLEGKASRFEGAVPESEMKAVVESFLSVL